MAIWQGAKELAIWETGKRDGAKLAPDHLLLEALGDICKDVYWDGYREGMFAALAEGDLTINRLANEISKIN